MRALLITCLLFICSTTVRAQFIKPLPPSTLDSLSTEISFIPNNFLSYSLEVNIPENSTFDQKFDKTLRVTGRLLKDILLRNKFDGTGFYPYTSRLNVDTYTVTQYNSLYRNYPFSY
jgi:hypothetical protein